MKKEVLTVIILFIKLCAYGQNSSGHFIAFYYTGSQTKPVYSLYIHIQNNIHQIAKQSFTDTLYLKSISTSKKSYRLILGFINKSGNLFSSTEETRYFGTFTIIAEGREFYLPGFNTKVFFRNLVLFLRKKNLDNKIADLIPKMYPWIYDTNRPIQNATSFVEGPVNLINAKDAIKHVGQVVTVEDTVYSGSILNDSTAVLQLGGPNIKFKIFLLNKAYASNIPAGTIKKAFDIVLHSKAIFRGTIILFKGEPTIYTDDFKINATFLKSYHDPSHGIILKSDTTH